MGYSEMEAMISTWGDQLRWRSELDPESSIRPEIVLVCGMGGSGISGDFASIFSEVPLLVHKGYGLPPWAKVARPTVLAVSYSGNTEETLSAVAEARSMGLEMAAVTGGGELARIAADNGWPVVTVPTGLQPRAALGYLLAGVSALLAAFGVAKVGPDDFNDAAILADSLLTDGSAARNLARDLAEGLDGRIVGVYGSIGLVAPAAQRWKTQINENGKWPAFWSLMPELDHNEIVSWSSLAQLTRQKVGLVALRDQAEGARIDARFRHTMAVTEGDVAWVGEVWSQGTAPLERLVSLTIVGDLLSLELSQLAGVDPVPVDAIENLKQRLAEETE